MKAACVCLEGAEESVGNRLLFSRPRPSPPPRPHCLSSAPKQLPRSLLRPPVCCFRFFIHIAARAIFQKADLPDRVISPTSRPPITFRYHVPSAWLLRRNWPRLLSLIVSLIVPHLKLQFQRTTCHLPESPFLCEPWASTYVCSLPETALPSKFTHVYERGKHTHTHPFVLLTHSLPSGPQHPKAQCHPSCGYAPVLHPTYARRQAHHTR